MTRRNVPADANRNSMKGRMPRVGIVLFPWASVGPYTFVNDMIEILDPISDSIVIITGNANRIKKSANTHVADVGLGVHYVRDSSRRRISALIWICKSMAFQLISGALLAKYRSRLDIVLFLAHPYATLPIATCRMLGIKSVEIVTRGKSRSDNLPAKLSDLAESVSYNLCSSISFETKALSESLSNTKWKHKVVGEAARFVNPVSTTLDNSVAQRNRTVAYIGRFRQEKGVLKLLEAAPHIVEKTDLDILFVGSGDLENRITSTLSTFEPDIRKRIRVKKWVSREEMASILSQTLILVLPSESEGLPTIVLEAMAAGTIVLATKVGGIEDVIVDNMTGFLLKEDRADSIEEGIIEILKNPYLDQISDNARNLVREKYSLDEARKRYERMIKSAIADESCMN